jgi:hypothetical protein
MTRLRTAFAIALALTLATACKKKDDTAAATKGSAAPAAAAPAAGDLPWKPDSMGHDSPACHKALACCEAKVKAEKPDAKAEDYNGACSGAALAASDDACEQFRKGYVDELNVDKKPVPAACN